jgi:hypothetical protein
MNKFIRIASLLSVIAALGGGSASCAGERDEINRVQPHAIPKSMFVRADANGSYIDDSDSWYFRATVIDAPAANSVPAYIGTAGDMARMKWKIEEKWLLAYQEHPDVEGTGDIHGGVVAAFPILSHFDIRRSYNPNTGEDSNVVEENTTDRPWYTREYMRVDWSTNKISEAGFVFPAYESVSAATYYVQDPKDENFPIFTKDYVDITAHYTVQPTPATCYYIYRSYTCGTGQVSARLSFMKVPERDYLPRDYPDRLQILDPDGQTLRSLSGTPFSLPMQDQFGFFRVERAIYDQRMGSLEKRYIYRARIWNIWDKWFQRDANGKVLFDDGSALDEKEARTLIAYGKKKPKLLPYADRKVRPIVYFINSDWPKDMLPMARDVAKGWNDAFQETVAANRLLEKEPTISMDKLRAEVEAMKSRKEDVFVLCENNPVKEGDPAACGPVGTIARLGDQRFSFMYWVNKPQPTGPLGLGPSYSDPITGELFSAGAHLYGAALDTLAQRGLEVVNLLNGKFKENDYIEGVHTDEYAKRLAKGEVPGPSSSFKDTVPGSPGFDLDKLKAQVDKTIDRPLLDTIAKKGLPEAKGPSGIDRIKMIKGTPLERAILDNPEMRAMLGKPRDMALTDDELHSVTDIIFGKDLRHEEEQRAKFLGEHNCFYPTEFADDATLGLAKELLKKYGKGASPAEDEAIQKKMWQDIRHYYARQVMEHEVGHTLGMAHNFEGSADPINFFDDFWKLKGDKPKYGEAPTAAQIDGKVTEYQYSTVMDYTSRFNSEIHGLGKYDYAAIRFAYGDVVETWPAGKVIDPLYQVDPTRFQYNLGFQGYSAEYLDNINRAYRHYTQIPSEFADGTKSLFKSGRELRKFRDVYDNATAQYQFVPQDKRGGVKTGGWKPSSANAKIYDTTKPIDVVPYRWCGDQLAGSVGRPMCERWDTGVDNFEVVKDAIERYRSYYVFDAFVRGRVDGLNRLRSYLGTVSSRYFSHVHRHYIHWLFNGVYGARPYYWANVLNKGGEGVKLGYITDPDWYKDPAGGLPASTAVYWGLDRLVDVLGTPDVGTYAANPVTGVFTQTSPSIFACTEGGNPTKCASDASTFTLNLEDGARYRYTAYDTSSGYYGFDKVKVIGSFYDKMGALLSITDSNANFVGQDTTNATSYRIGFYLAYPRGLSTVFGGMVTDKLDQYAWRYSFEGGKPTFTSPDVFAQVGRDDWVDPVPTTAGKAVNSEWLLYYKAYALLFSMAEFQANYSQSWNDAIRVWCVGCGEAFTPGAGIETSKFTNPLSGKEYAAIKYGDGRYSPGFQLVEEGKVLVKAYNDAVTATDTAKIAQTTAALNEHIKLLDLVRGLYEVYGYSRF